LIVTRFLHYAATALLEGTFVFWCFISWATFRAAQGTQSLRTRFDRSLLPLAWASLIVALISGAAWLVIVGSHMSGMPLAAVVRGGVLGVVLMQTRFGEVWLIRLALIALLACCLALRGRSWMQAANWIGLVASAAFMVSLAWAGHGAAAEDVPFDGLHLPADILHLLATGAWLGALLPLVILLAQAGRDGSSEAVSAARTATVRFSTLGISSVATLLVTGLVNTWFLSGSIPALLGTTYGQLLLIKVALFLTMIAVANVNRGRLVPRLAESATEASIRLRTVRQLRRNASIEVSLGVFVLGVVGIIGILPPGLHTEPQWPLPFRIDLSDITAGARTILDIAVAAFALCLLAATFTAGRRRYRQMAASVVGVIVLGGVGWAALRPGIVRAYPTSFYASTQPYASPSIAQGAPLYAENCAVCHGAQGRGDGPLAGELPVRPADLTEPHLFAHKVGEIYWWVSHGSDNRVMPGFSGKLDPDERWDVINFILARTAGALTRHAGSQIAATAVPPLPDFAFEQDSTQSTLSQTLKNGPVLLILFAAQAPYSRLEQLAQLEDRFASAGLRVIAVGLKPSTIKAPFVVQVSSDVRTTLALFRSPADGSETELMLDRGAEIRARWTASTPGGLADAATLLRDTVRVASIPVAPANHAGHAH
jgi:putative copper resistance protein D